MARQVPVGERRLGYVGVSGGGAARPYSVPTTAPTAVRPFGAYALADAVERLGQPIRQEFQAQVKQAEVKAARESSAAGTGYALATDPDDLQLPAGDTIGEEAFRRSALEAASAKVEIRARQDVADLRRQFEGKPDEFMKALADRKGKFLGGLPPELSSDASLAYERLGAAAFLDVDEERRAFERDAHRADLLTLTDQITTSAAQLARSGRYEAAMEELAHLADKTLAAGPVAAGGSGALSLTEIERSGLAASELIRKNFLEGWVERTPNKRAALAGLRTGQTGDAVVDGVLAVTAPDVMDQYSRMLEADIKQQEVEARQAQREREAMARQAAAEAREAQRLRVSDLKDQTRFAVDMIGRGLPVNGLPDLAKRIAAEGEAAAPLLEALDGAQEVADFSRGFAMVPVENQMQEIERLRAEPQTPETFAKLNAAVGVLKGTAEAVREGRGLQHAADVGIVKLAPVDFADPASVAARVQSARTASAYMGGPVEMFTPAERTAEASRLAAMPGEQKAEYLSLLQASSGDAYPDVIRELGLKGGLDRGSRYLSLLAGRPEAAPIANAVGEALDTDPKDLKVNLVRAGVSEADVDREVDAALKPFLDTLGPTYAQGSGGGAQALITDVTDIVKRTAMVQMRTMSARDAVRSAADAFINSRYEFRDGYRIPKPSVGGEAAIERIDQMMADTVAALSPELIDPPGSIEGVDEATRRSGYLEAVRNRGQWATLPDESGLVLLDENGNAVTAKGRPVVVKF